jgi:hypothetical protein
MEIELLAPGMEDRADAQIAVEPVAPKLKQTLGGRVEQQRVEESGVSQDQCVELPRQSQDTMIIRGGQ